MGFCRCVLCSFSELLLASVSSGNSSSAGNLEAGKPSSLRDVGKNGVWYARGMHEGTGMGSQ